MIMKLKKRPGPKGTIEPMKKRIYFKSFGDISTSLEACECLAISHILFLSM
jgi:hypothetical protein